MCTECDKILESSMSIDEIKNVPYIQVDLHEEKGTK